MAELCAVCNGVIRDVTLVTINEELFKVCCFDCKDVLVEGREVDVGCGIIEGDKVRDVKMCGECLLLSMPFSCYATKRDQGRTLMFVGYGRMKQEKNDE